MATSKCGCVSIHLRMAVYDYIYVLKCAALHGYIYVQLRITTSVWKCTARNHTRHLSAMIVWLHLCTAVYGYIYVRLCITTSVCGCV